MKRLVSTAILFAGTVLSQQVSLDANSIVVTAVKTVILPPTDVTFNVNVSAEYGVTLEQVLAGVDLGLTAQDLMGINSYPIGPYPPYPQVPGTARINYLFRLSVPLAKMKETVDKLEKLRKTLDTGMDLSYNTISVGPSVVAAREARDKALPDLMADAQKRAQMLAAAAQLKLGAIQAVSEPYSYSESPAGAVTPTMPISVTVRFAAQP